MNFGRYILLLGLVALPIKAVWAHGFGMGPGPAMMGGGMMAPPGGGMMPPPAGGMNGPMAPPPGGNMMGAPSGGNMMGPPMRGGMPNGRGSVPGRGAYPGYGAYGQGNPWWGETYMDGWYMMPWMAANARNGQNTNGSSSGGQGQNSNQGENNPSSGYGSAWNGYDYGQYVPPMGHVMPPPSDPGSDATSEFNCKNGYFYDSLTEKCEKQH